MAHTNPLESSRVRAAKEKLIESALQSLIEAEVDRDLAEAFLSGLFCSAWNQVERRLIETQLGDARDASNRVRIRSRGFER